MNSFQGKLRKRNGKLLHQDGTNDASFEAFKATIPEGKVVDVFMQVKDDNGGLSQLAKIHALIRTLSAHIGEDPKRIKTLVKDRAGLCFVHNDNGIKELICKSFGDCSYQDLDLAIHATIDIGREVNLPLQ